MAIVPPPSLPSTQASDGVPIKGSHSQLLFCYWCGQHCHQIKNINKGVLELFLFVLCVGFFKEIILPCVKVLVENGRRCPI